MKRDFQPPSSMKNGRDAILKVTACAICGSVLHLMGGFVPEMKSGDALGHECMGEVVEVGRENPRARPLRARHRVSRPSRTSNAAVSMPMR
jgi:threonine dehydrogenase-like Zn-dependent dehydrogenase